MKHNKNGRSGKTRYKTFYGNPPEIPAHVIRQKVRGFAVGLAGLREEERLLRNTLINICCQGKSQSLPPSLFKNRNGSRSSKTSPGSRLKNKRQK
jgi:hypothetical protein